MAHKGKNTLNTGIKKPPFWTVIVPLSLLLVLLLAMGLLPVQSDPAIAEADWGVGTVGVDPPWVGLQRDWHDADTDIDPALANLGYLLFFDPLLSGENDLSCAHCHHPDKGFGDGRMVAENAAGEQLNRHSSSLWNVAYNASFFWDGRAGTLAGQLLVPLLAANEMNQNPLELIRELAAVDAYAAAFNALFEDGITLDNAAAAIAEFELTLVSSQAPFDLYAAGDFEALTPQQRRGVTIFHSAETSCLECHFAPAFTDGSFRVIGVPDNGSDDKGRGMFQAGLDYAFKVPTLRNAVLSAPYMHNGSLADIEDVIDFYAQEAQNFEPSQVDFHVAQGFNLSAQERADLVAFLYALVDETIPQAYWQGLNYIDTQGHILVPESVPSGSGLVVKPFDNPARHYAAQVNARPEDRPECKNRDPSSRTITVTPGQTIQQAVDCARAGDTVLVPPGLYKERLVIDIDGITLRGLVDDPEMCPLRAADGAFPIGDKAANWPVMDGDVDGDGKSDLTDGVSVAGDDFKMEHFILRNYTRSGVRVDGSEGVTVRQTYAENTGLHAIFTGRSANVLLECSLATKNTDSAITVSQSSQFIVRQNLVYDNTTGIQVENSANGAVYGNEIRQNASGLLLSFLPNLAARVSTQFEIYDNTILDNNKVSRGFQTSQVLTVPNGAGIALIGSDHAEVYNNRIENNATFGIAVTALDPFYEYNPLKQDGPRAEYNHIHDNVLLDNGTNPDPAFTAAGLSGADLVWDGAGAGSTWDQPAATRFPPVLPSSGWSAFAQRLLYRLWNLNAKLR